MLYATPVVFGSMCNFGEIHENTIRIRTVGAVNLVDWIDVAKFASVKVDIVPQTNFLESIQGE